MIKSNAFSILGTLLFIACFSSITYSQPSALKEYTTLFDSVKTFYGDTCFIGVSSELINRLYAYQNYKPVKTYLDSYETIRRNIEKFRKMCIKSIYNENALLLDLTQIFTLYKQQNIVNLCGVFLGPDSVTSIGLSYIILRVTPLKFYSKLYQINNFDSTFKKELISFGDDWYYSMKLSELNTNY
jgi:hypothetical protein